MCGRYALAVVTADLIQEFKVEKAPDFPLEERYNIAPTQPVLIVREDHDSGTGKRELTHVVWGLIPPWAEDPSIGSRMINARAETVAEKPAFRNALKRRRCLVPASGFYEWALPPPSAPPGARKTPFFFHMRSEHPFGFAGLWETWSGPNGELLESCTILTTRANTLVAPVHDRMPVILSPRDYGLWLDPSVQNPSDILPLLRPYDPSAMAGREVSTMVNSPRNDGRQLVEPAG